MLITGETVATEALMLRHATAGTVLIVEGGGDEKAYRKFASDPEIAIVVSWGKERALEAIDILEREGRLGFVAIVDADFWCVDGHIPASDNVLVTDDHDLEMMMIRGSSFEAVISELGSKNKIEQFFEKSCVSSLRDVLFEGAIYVGVLRWQSHALGLSLCFDGLKFARFIDKSTLALDKAALVDSVLKLTEKSTLGAAELLEILDTYKNACVLEPYKYCCGHDVVSVLGIGLRKCLGSLSGQRSSVDDLEQALRLAYSFEDFSKTSLYSQAAIWSLKNPDYSVFR